MENKVTTPVKDEFDQTLLPGRDDVRKVITILLSNNSPQVRKDFHCIECGRICFNYYSEVRVIIIGEMREISRPVDVMCSRCKIMYRIG